MNSGADIVPKRHWCGSDTSWMKSASEDELRAFVKWLDADTHNPMRGELLSAFGKECDRRAAEYYEQKAEGEWL